MDNYEIIDKAKELGFTNFKPEALNFLAEKMPNELLDKVKLLVMIIEESQLQGRRAQQKIQTAIIKSLMQK